MISILRGCIIEKLAHTVIIDVRGVGYEVRVTPRMWQQARSGGEIVVYTHFHVREDAQVLFGFADLRERDMFRTLLTVNSVGPKIAMAVLSVAAPDDIIRAVQNEDLSALKAPGVGPKIVKRLLSELKSVFGETSLLSASDKPGQQNVRMDVIEALKSLGYNERETEQMLAGVEMEGKSLDDALRAVLQKR